jgi:hypothetical protein
MIRPLSILTLATVLVGGVQCGPAQPRSSPPTSQAVLDEASRLNKRVEKLYSEGKFGEAIPVVERALSLREKALGPMHPDVAESLNNLASLYKDQGAYPKAEQLLVRALDIREKALGSMHPDVAENLNNLAWLYQAQGAYPKAEPLYVRALDIREKTLGPMHPDVAQSLNNLAELSLGDLPPALLHGLDGPSMGELQVRHADWSADGKELVVYVEHRPARGVGSGVSSGAPPARLLWMDHARKVIAVPWTGRSFALTSVLFGAHWMAAAGKQLMVWDRHSHAQVATLDVHSLVIRDLAFSPDDRVLASVSNDHKIALVDTATWKTRASWDAHDGDVVGVAFHPSRPVIATTGQDRQVRLWTLDGKRLAEAKLPGPGNAVAFSADGARLVVATDDKVVVFALK